MTDSPWTELNINDYAPETSALGKIILPICAPFDGKPVLVKTNVGVVEAWWQSWTSTPTLEDPNDGDGWQWVCYDDAFQLEPDDVQAWMPIPTVDHRDLLRRYMDHVGNAEGITFLHDKWRENGFMTDDQWEELRRINDSPRPTKKVYS